MCLFFDIKMAITVTNKQTNKEFNWHAELIQHIPKIIGMKQNTEIITSMIRPSSRTQGHRQF